MTVEEALNLFKDHEYWADISPIDEACEIAIKALEKQIPKKPPKNTQFPIPNFICPSCGGFTYRYDEYCKGCGQALDWSDAE